MKNGKFHKSLLNPIEVIVTGSIVYEVAVAEEPGGRLELPETP
jgi:hypothetical protein